MFKPSQTENKTKKMFLQPPNEVHDGRPFVPTKPLDSITRHLISHPPPNPLKAEKRKQEQDSESDSEEEEEEDDISPTSSMVIPGDDSDPSQEHVSPSVTTPPPSPPPQHTRTRKRKILVPATPPTPYPCYPPRPAKRVRFEPGCATAKMERTLLTPPLPFLREIYYIDQCNPPFSPSPGILTSAVREWKGDMCTDDINAFVALCGVGSDHHIREIIKTSDTNPLPKALLDLGLCSAAEQGRRSTIAMLTSMGATPSPLAISAACSSGFVDIYENMVPNAEWREAALFGAAKGGRLDLARRFRGEGATDVNSALEVASHHGQIEMARYLISEGADNFDQAIEASLCCPEVYRTEMEELLSMHACIHADFAVATGKMFESVRRILVKRKEEAVSTPSDIDHGALRDEANNIMVSLHGMYTTMIRKMYPCLSVDEKK